MNRLRALCCVVFLLLALVACDRTPTESKTEKIDSPVKLIVKGRIDYPDENGKMISVDTKGKEQEIILPPKYWGKTLNKNASECNQDNLITILDMSPYGHVQVWGGSSVGFEATSTYLCEDPNYFIWRIEPQIYIAGTGIVVPTYNQRAKGGFNTEDCSVYFKYSPWTSKSAGPHTWQIGDWSDYFYWPSDACYGQIIDPTVFVDMAYVPEPHYILVRIVRLHIQAAL